MSVSVVFEELKQVKLNTILVSYASD